MGKESGKIMVTLFLAVCFLTVGAAGVSGAEYEGLKGLKSVKAVFDVRIGTPESASLHLKLIHQTFKDKNVRAVQKKPSFVVVFIGPSVKLVSKNREGFSPEEQKILVEIAGTIAAMAKEGVKFEICLFAAKVFGVEPASILPEIKKVGNGWISLIGYEAKGYSLVPAY
jgi:intracellular sulfur oxidation DsrE/DsrF family protein